MSWAGCRWRWSRPAPTCRPAGRGIAGYLALFRQRRADLLARGEIAGYDKQVATTWALAFDQLQQTSPQAIGLLRLLACCAPEQIPLHLLLQPRPGLAELARPGGSALLLPLLEDPLAADDAVAALRRYSLISPPAGGLGVGAPAGASRHPRPAARRSGRRPGGRPPGH